MKPVLDVLLLIINIGLIIGSLRLSQIVSGSVFANIPRLLIVLAIALTIHSGVDLFLRGDYERFLYGLTALIASISYLLVVYGVFVVLRRITASGGKLR